LCTPTEKSIDIIPSIAYSYSLQESMGRENGKGKREKGKGKK